MSVTFHRLTGDSEKELTNEVHAFRAQQASDDQVAWHAVVAAQTAERKVIGISIVRKVVVPLLNNNAVYECRCLLKGNEEFFQSLLSETLSFLASARANENTVGVMIIVHKEFVNLNPWLQQPMWEPGFMLMGFTKSGSPIYIHYFKNARI